MTVSVSLGYDVGYGDDSMLSMKLDKESDNPADVVLDIRSPDGSTSTVDLSKLAPFLSPGTAMHPPINGETEPSLPFSVTGPKTEVVMGDVHRTMGDFRRRPKEFNKLLHDD